MCVITTVVAQELNLNAVVFCAHLRRISGKSTHYFSYLKRPQTPKTTINRKLPVNIVHATLLGTFLVVGTRPTLLEDYLKIPSGMQVFLKSSMSRSWLGMQFQQAVGGREGKL